LDFGELLASGSYFSTNAYPKTMLALMLAGIALLALGRIAQVNFANRCYNRLGGILQLGGGVLTVGAQIWFLNYANTTIKTTFQALTFTTWFYLFLGIYALNIPIGLFIAVFKSYRMMPEKIPPIKEEKILRNSPIIRAMTNNAAIPLLLVVSALDGRWADRTYYGSVLGKDGLQFLFLGVWNYYDDSFIVEGGPSTEWNFYPKATLPMLIIAIALSFAAVLSRPKGKMRKYLWIINSIVIAGGIVGIIGISFYVGFYEQLLTTIPTLRYGPAFYGLLTIFTGIIFLALRELRVAYGTKIPAIKRIITKEQEIVEERKAKEERAKEMHKEKQQQEEEKRYEAKKRTVKKLLEKNPQGLTLKKAAQITLLAEKTIAEIAEKEWQRTIENGKIMTKKELGKEKKNSVNKY
jgi:hypothetical protein